MSPLILHNVPDEELYVGSDGVQRPYAMVHSQYVVGDCSPPLPHRCLLTTTCHRHEVGSRNRRSIIMEKGSFGKSNRRSRSRTATPGRAVRDDPNTAAADKIWGEWQQSFTAKPDASSTADGASRGTRLSLLPGLSAEEQAPTTNVRTTSITPAADAAHPRAQHDLLTGSISGRHHSGGGNADVAAGGTARRTSTGEQLQPVSATGRVRRASAGALQHRRLAPPTARRIELLPAEQALMPQQSYARRMLGSIPLVRWFAGNMIGNEVPRTESGEFDWQRASLYWKFIWWLDAFFGIFGGDILHADKE